MNVYLVHHTSVLSAEQDPERHLSEAGRAECARLGGWLKENDVTPVRILTRQRWRLTRAIPVTMSIPLLPRSRPRTAT